MSFVNGRGGHRQQKNANQPQILSAHIVYQNTCAMFLVNWTLSNALVLLTLLVLVAIPVAILAITLSGKGNKGDEPKAP